MPKIAFVGEAYGRNEDVLKTPFVGASGIELLKMADEGGLIELTSFDKEYFYRYYAEADPTLIDCVWKLHPELCRFNVFNFHPPGNKIETVCGPKKEGIPGFPALVKGKFVRAEFKDELERLGDELVEADPDLIICLGNTPLWALCAKTGISKLRGTTCLSTHTAAGFKMFLSYHPAAILHQWELRSLTVIDFMKASREAQFPEIRRPHRKIWIEPDLEDIRGFFDRYIHGRKRDTHRRPVAVDIETAGNQITCIGFSPDRQNCLVIPFYDPRRKGRSYWPDKHTELAVWGLIGGVLADPEIRKTFQNGLYDIAFLWRSVGIKTFGAEHDTMLLHHALQPESLKGLEFLGSVYTDEGPWKRDRKGSTTIKRDD